MKTNDITKAKNPALRGSLNALRRSAAAARKVAIQTDTDLIIVKDGKLLRLSAEELRRSAEGNAPKP
ncbi:MAG: hypothetical protein JNK37_22465 [Verrucomicrobiales bacterium]|nr:hypothetical protein [Verrucomicrobiales bacterium]